MGTFNKCYDNVANAIEDYDVLIGMDIIGLGDIAITNKDEKTKFAFRIPSTEEISF